MRASQALLLLGSTLLASPAIAAPLVPPMLTGAPSAAAIAGEARRVEPSSNKA